MGWRSCYLRCTLTPHMLSQRRRNQLWEAHKRKLGGNVRLAPLPPLPRTPVSEAGRLWASVGRDVESVQF